METWGAKDSKKMFPIFACDERDSVSQMPNRNGAGVSQTIGRRSLKIKRRERRDDNEKRGCEAEGRMAEHAHILT